MGQSCSNTAGAYECGCSRFVKKKFIKLQITFQKIYYLGFYKPKKKSDTVLYFALYIITVV